MTNMLAAFTGGEISTGDPGLSVYQLDPPRRDRHSAQPEHGCGEVYEAGEVDGLPEDPGRQ
jgi:hypothetical protein